MLAPEGVERIELSVDETLVPFFVRSILNTARCAGPSKPGKIAESIRNYLVDDPELVVGLGVKQIEEEVIPAIRDTVFNGGEDPRYRGFVKRYMDPLGIDGRTGEKPRPEHLNLVQEGLF